MTKEQLASLLNGRAYMSEITNEEQSQAKTARLVVVFGYSDDNVELRGFIRDEIGAYGDTEFKVSPLGLVQDWESFRDNAETEKEFQAYFDKKKDCQTIVANWDADGYSWTFTTDIPHATFEIVDGDEKFCRGIVFSIDQLIKSEPAEQNHEGPDHGEHLDKVDA